MSRYAAPISFELRTSRGYTGGLTLTAALAIVACALADLPSWLMWLLALSCVLTTVLALRAHLLLNGASMRLHADGAVRWRDRSGSEDHGHLLHHVRLGPLIAVELRLENGRKRRLALWRDMTDADSWRRLRVDLAHRNETNSYTD